MAEAGPVSMQAAAREGQTFGGGSAVAKYASFVKLPHTLFALPFAGVGAVLASRQYPSAINVSRLALVVLAFTAARFAAMGFNRIVDRHYDALNPRTQQRELPSGRLTLMQAVLAVVLASVVFVASAFILNPLCGWLSPVALLWIFGYSYAKRFTAAAHHMLGFALGIAPVGAYLAISGEWSTPWYALVLLALGVTFWVAGFDVIYALQDLDFDRKHDLHSIPVAVGFSRALVLARVFHALAFCAFVSLVFIESFGLGILYLAGLTVMAGLLLYEHAVIGRGDPARMDLPRIDRAFFHANIGVSVSIFAFTLLDRLLV